MNNANDLMQTLYLIQSGNYLKIGITNNIPARIREYQTHNPDFNIISVRDGTRYDELFLHRLLKKYLVNKSEWICFSQEIITTFKNIDLPHTGEVKEQIRKERENLKYTYSSHKKNPKNKGINNGMFGRVSANARSVLQFDQEGNFIQEWPSAAEAKRSLGIDNITVVCNGNRRSAGGYIWVWGQNDYSSKGQKVAQYDLDNNFINVYNSSWDAAKQLGLDSSSIYKVCQGKGKTCGGFIWKFYGNE